MSTPNHPAGVLSGFPDMEEPGASPVRRALTLIPAKEITMSVTPPAVWDQLRQVKSSPFLPPYPHAWCHLRRKAVNTPEPRVTWPIQIDLNSRSVGIDLIFVMQDDPDLFALIDWQFLDDALTPLRSGKTPMPGTRRKERYVPYEYAADAYARQARYGSWVGWSYRIIEVGDPVADVAEAVVGVLVEMIRRAELLARAGVTPELLARARVAHHAAVNR
ncbi:hypothetical protein [Amycolatopsis sp. NPDC051371]|uniref:hypothetical protein n=1 Tax=Amycolatopsis sp. NPDC051371 TaxID=3155800 RepID=UPI00341A1ABD